MYSRRKKVRGCFERATVAATVGYIYQDFEQTGCDVILYNIAASIYVLCN